MSSRHLRKVASWTRGNAAERLFRRKLIERCQKRISVCEFVKIVLIITNALLARDRLEMIRIVCAAMEQQFGARPARRQIAEVAREMVARYPQSLRDEPGEATVFGKFLSSCSQQIELSVAQDSFNNSGKALTIGFWIYSRTRLRPGL